jgi:hypothetical protein
MLTKTKIALAAALILGAASAAQAHGAQGGHRVQTWQEIQQAWQQHLSQEHNSNAGNAYGYVASPNQTSHVR